MGNTLRNISKNKKYTSDLLIDGRLDILKFVVA